MPRAIKRAMDVDRGVKVSIRLIVTHRAREELPPPLCDATACSVGKPFPLGPAARAVLTSTVRIHLNGSCAACRIGLVFGAAVDLAAQLIGLSAIEAP